MKRKNNNMSIWGIVDYKGFRIYSENVAGLPETEVMCKSIYQAKDYFHEISGLRGLNYKIVCLERFPLGKANEFMKSHLNKDEIVEVFRLKNWLEHGAELDDATYDYVAKRFCTYAGLETEFRNAEIEDVWKVVNEAANIFEF